MLKGLFFLKFFEKMFMILGKRGHLVCIIISIKAEYKGKD